VPATPRSARWFNLLLAGVCVIAGVAIVYQSRTIAQQNRQQALLTEQNRKLAEQLRSAREGIPEPQSALPAFPPPSSVPGARKSNRPIDEARGEDETQPLRENLAEANATVARLEARIGELEAQLEKVTADSKQSAANEETLNQNLAEATRTVESLQKETKNQSRRLSEMETANQHLREQTTQSTGAASQFAKLFTDLQDVNRRRDNYVSSILRRYKDITDQYRALSIALDGRRDRQSAPLGEAELARIQNSIAMTEEDLRQINVLSAQASSILKKIPQR
jgi:septal ring factor EnvC (AmiA/AmiB activator)